MNPHYSLAEQLRYLAAVLVLLGALILLAVAAARLKGIVLERSQRLERLLDPAD